MQTINTTLTDALAKLTTAGITGARFDAQLLLAHILGKDRAWLLAHDDTALTDEQISAFQELISKRAEHIPVVHLTGTREFYGLDLHITPDVLTPRVETEQMVEWTIKYAPHGGRLIDMGTGSGAIAVAIAKHRPDLTVTATDISPLALKVAKQNARKHRVVVDFAISDLWSQVLRTGLFDVVVTNLPYLTDDANIMPEVRREPAVALFGGPDGLSLYRRFLAGLPDHLSPGGYLFTECDPWQQEALIAEAAKQGLKPVEQGYFILGFHLPAQ